MPGRAIDNSPIPLSADSRTAVRRLLRDAAGLLGACTPLPALFEEVIRARRGMPVQGARFQQACALMTRLQEIADWQAALTDAAGDAGEGEDLRLLAAVLLAHAGVSRVLPAPSPGDAFSDTIFALAHFSCSAQSPWYRHTLQHWLAAHDEDTTPAPALPLLCFLHGLQEAALSDGQFTRCVLHLGVLHPAIASRRPLRRINRLLDYLGLSDEMHVQQQYRRLVAEIWPQASAANWPRWQWVTAPGGPEVFQQAIRAVQAGDFSLMRLHELKYAPCPGGAERVHLLREPDTAILLLLCWLRPDMADDAHLPGGTAALRWLAASNQTAAMDAYAHPEWWEAWLGDGLPAARQALAWLQEIVLPVESDQSRAGWLEAHLLPAYRRICANLLLAQAASGEQIEAIIALAEDSDLPAIRALALFPTPTERVVKSLYHLRRAGGRPVKDAAEQALAQLAQRRGLPGADELERQSMLAAAWDLGPLAGERVRVGWQEGGYRLRLSLDAGKVRLDVLGPRGPLTRLPAELYRCASYQEARAAQKEVQAQYRLFKGRLETYMLEARPISGGEFRYLLSNPIFAHLAERLVWQTADGATFLWAGPDCWETCAGEAVNLFADKDRTPLTLTPAHPITLSHNDTLVHWQAMAVDRRLLQPFKQIFREIYLPADDEGDRCARFAGLKIDTQRAYALLRSAGFSPGAGVARRDWPGHLTAHLCWAQDAVSHDLFGPQRLAAVTTGDIRFTRKGMPLPIHDVPPVIFSETLRAADLLTTRAAIGDAELTSRETIVLRATLLREVARSFSLTNIAVREEGPCALVFGMRATYRVNLASGTIFLDPEGRQILLPSHDVRWRLAEEGDTTSDILAIVLALAHDQTIGDLTFLAQLSPHPLA